MKLAGRNDVLPDHGTDGGRLAVTTGTCPLGNPNLIVVVALKSCIVTTGGVEHIVISNVIDSFQSTVDGGGISIGDGRNGREGSGGPNKG